MIASRRPGAGGRRSRPSTAVVEVGGVGLAVQCTPPRSPTLRLGEPARLADLPRRPRGLPDPLRLRRRRRAARLRAPAVGDRRRPAAGAGGAGRARARRAAARRRHRGPRGAIQVPGIGRKGAQRIVLELKDRLGAPVGAVVEPVRRPGQRSRLARPGARRAVGLGWSAREADDGRRPRSADRGRRRPRRRGRCSGCALQTPEPGRDATEVRRPDARATASSVVRPEATADERAVEVALRPHAPRRVHRPGARHASSSGSCSTRARGRGSTARPRAAAPARPGSARPRWR